MSENEISEDDQSTLAEASTPISPPASTQMSARAVVATVVVMMLVVAFGASLAWSKREKTDSRKIAAVVDGKQITTKELDSSIASWIGNKEFVAAMAQANTAIVDAKGKALPAYRAQRLDALIQQTIFEAAFEKAGLKVSKPYVDGLRKQIAADPSAKGFDSAFLDDFVESRGRFEALRVAKSKPITDDQVKAAYDQQYACASGKSVAHLLVKTEAEANAALQRIQNGESFATVAQAVSTDTGSQQKGGELGCLAAGAFVPAFETAALAAAVGTPTAPVKTEFGYHVIETAVFVAPALAEVRAEIVAALQAQDTSGNDSLRKFLDSAKVTIEDRSIGTWGTTAQGVPGVIAKGTSTAPTSGEQPPVGTPTTQAATPNTGLKIQQERPQEKSK